MTTLKIERIFCTSSVDGNSEIGIYDDNDVCLAYVFLCCEPENDQYEILLRQAKNLNDCITICEEHGIDFELV